MEEKKPQISREQQLQNQIAMYKRQPRANNQRIIQRIQKQLESIRKAQKKKKKKKPKPKPRYKKSKVKFTSTSRINPKRRTGIRRRTVIKPKPVSDPNKAKRQQVKGELAKWRASISGDHGRGRMYVVRVRRKIAALRDQLVKLRPIKQKRAKYKK